MSLLGATLHIGSENLLTQVMMASAEYAVSAFRRRATRRRAQ
jgi:hypothetical protein